MTKETRRKKIIVVPKWARQELMDRFDASQAAVYNALGYNSDSERAAQIRECALNNYGGRIDYKTKFV